ncbi:MAG: MASE3 domain-containing protein [Desulfotignum sp.]|nr:MASE3 domain-containing protein [Desulfotignum sp.]
MIQNLFMIFVLVGLYFTTFVNYLLFHSLAEIFSIVVACSFFMITWNSKKYIKNQYILFIGIAYLFIALLDLLHTLAYKGMPIFTDYDYYANQLWIGARYLESITLIVAFYVMNSDRNPKPEVLFATYFIITTLIVLSVFVWKVFPVCFVEGVGLTPFKKISEYIICSILLAGIFILNKNKNKFDPKIYRNVLFSIIFTIISELSFTFYINNYGFSNLVGHYFKIFSFYLIYRAIIETGIRQPYKLIFKELDTINKNLKNEINARIKVEEDRERTILQLQKALSEIKTLSGLLPICSHCKKIRDDRGYWNQLEDYIHEHSDVKFSHGICRECAKKHYPDFDIYDD